MITPPFYQRMVDAEREIMFLPKTEGLIQETFEFEHMKKDLAQVTAEAKDEEKNRPSLLSPDLAMEYRHSKVFPFEEVYLNEAGDFEEGSGDAAEDFGAVYRRDP
jgi:hypothetical protein